MERRVLAQLELDETQPPARADAEFIASSLPLGDGFDI